MQLKMKKAAIGLDTRIRTKHRLHAPQHCPGTQSCTGGQSFREPAALLCSKNTIAGLVEKDLLDRLIVCVKINIYPRLKVEDEARAVSELLELSAEGVAPCTRVHPSKRPVLQVVLRMVMYYSESYPISQNISVVFRTTRKDSTGRFEGCGRLMGEHE